MADDYQLLKKKTEAIETLEADINDTRVMLNNVAEQCNVVLTRADDLEDRSRRNNLILHGIPDCEEKWEETEQKVLSLLSRCCDESFSADSIERAHRLGSFAEGRCRPVIVKFLSFKVKEKVSAARSCFKENNVTISDDFSVGTRVARSKLLEFAKSLPDSPSFKLRHNKLFINRACYVYDSINATIVKVHNQTHPTVPSNPSNPVRPSTSNESPPPS